MSWCHKTDTQRNMTKHYTKLEPLSRRDIPQEIPDRRGTPGEIFSEGAVTYI